ncbi:uncharacterized protein MELLADRAFT_109922 [Melampsora larici-populina 98AG31]|uniref:Uncharacterized protein n=1 Tax=Melampsora larici-populina (strain 98AG31 / pathotype 3-4-7) TaxID=747676 RepID=F4RY30_MELLP|nr:uncharacterized protein MELLADRAFT_109922 [Melampsora larici-populina 98AG31]EGG02713.1 hypothetical protein MELLADRAFT_109922 [Melampsora larici-populina 98AG31]
MISAQDRSSRVKRRPGMTMTDYKLSNDRGPSHNTITMNKDQRVYPRPNLPVFHKTDDDNNRRVDTKDKGKSVDPLALQSGLTLKLNEEEIKETWDRLKSRFMNYEPQQYVRQADVYHNPNQTDSEGEIIHNTGLAKIKENPELNRWMYKEYDQSVHLPHDFLKASLKDIHTNHQVTPTESTGSHCPHASTSAIPYGANTRATSPLNPGPSTGGLLRPSSQIMNYFDNEENLRNLPTLPDLIDAIQRVLLVCVDPACRCRYSGLVPEPLTSQEPAFVSMVIRRTLDNPFMYASIPVVIQLNRENHVMNPYKDSTRVSDRPVIPQSALLEVFHGPIEYLRVEGLTPDLIPHLISYFDSSSRLPIGLSARWMHVRFVIVGEFEGKTRELQLEKSMKECPIYCVK